jgi:sulfide:quinone oxidoreductase
MAKVVIIGAGFAGHTAAIYLGNKLGRDHEVTMINKFEYFLYLPSLVWVGVGHMQPEKVSIPLKPVYDKINVRFVQGTATEIHPDENYVLTEKADNRGQARVDYDYLLIATGPKLNWEGTPGSGPKNGYTLSICWLRSAIQTRDEYHEYIERMRRGEKVKFVFGVCHPEATCQGAAFEYLMNINSDLIKRGLRDKAELLYLSNEPALGDFGVGGIHTKKRGKIQSSEDYIKTLFNKYDIKWEVQKGVKKVDEVGIYWEDYEGNHGEAEYDFAMVIPQFIGQPIKYIGRDGKDVSINLINKGGFVLVDGFYGLPYKSLHYTPEAWPAIYQNPAYRNIFAAGIAFASPGPISVPHITPNGTNITAVAPRTGMVSGIIGRLVAKNIIGLIKDGKMAYQERMTEMFMACIASMDTSLWSGSAVPIALFPIAHNYLRFPNEYGRDEFITHFEGGLAGAWVKRIIHTTMLYKLRSYPGWQFIPE